MAKLSNINDLFSVDSTGAIEFSTQVGTTGYVLESRGAGNAPVWTDRDTGGVRGTGTENKVVRWNAAPATGDSQTIGDGPITFSSSGATADATFAGTISAVGASTFTLNDGIFIKAINGTNNVAATNVWGYGLYEDASKLGEISLVRDGTSSQMYIGTTGANQVLRIGSANKVTALTIDASQNATFAGNVGIGISPSASFSGVDVLQLGKGMTLMGNANDDRATMGANLYLDSNTAFRYVMDGYAGRFSIEDGQMIWGVSAIGNAGDIATVNTKMTLLNNGNVGIGNPLAGETYPRELLDIRQSSGTDYPKILVKYDFNDTTTPTTAPTSSLLLSPGQFSSDDTAPRVVGYRTANFASAAARSAGLKFGVAQNNNAKDAVMITEASDIWQLNGANSTSAFAPWDVSYPDEGICINTPANGTKYLSFADSQTPSYGGGMRYFEASNFTELYTKLAGNYTTHVRLDRASPYTTWLNPESNGNVGIGLGSTNPLPLAKLHLEGTGDMIRVVKNANTYGPQMDLILNQTSPSNGDTAAYINMGAKDNSGNSKYWGSIRAVVDNIFTEIGGFEFYTRAASDFSKRLKISAQGKVIVYQKDNVSGFYLDGANTRLYANGGGGTDYRGIEVNSSGMWSWGETGSSNFFANKVGMGTTNPSAPLDIGASGSVNNIGVAIFNENSTTAYSSGGFNSRPTHTLYGINTANTYVGTRLSHAGNTEFFHGIVKGAANGEATYVFQGYNGSAYQQFGQIDCYSTDAGTLTMSGDVVAYSDKKLKKNIKTLDGSKVYKMRGVSFDRIDTGKKSSGVIAQEMQEIAPELISESNETLGVSYGNLTGYLIEAIKELKAEIEELKSNKCNCNK
jgi:hypothetical protein